MFNLITGLSYLLFRGLWSVVQLSLIILGWVQTQFTSISKGLPFYVLFGASGDDVLTGKISVPTLFYKFLISSFVLLLIFFLFQVIRNKRKGQNESAWSLWTNALKHLAFSIFFIVCLCFVMYGMKFFIDLMYDGEAASLDKEIFRVIRPENISESEWDTNIDNNFDIPYSHFERIDSGFTFLLLGFVAAVVPMILLLFAILSVVIRTFHLFYLFILSPWFSAFTVVDNGETMKKWRMMFLSKFFTILLFPVVIQIYVLFVSRVMQFWDAYDSSNIFLHNFFKIILLVAAALSINSIGQITASFFGDNLGAMEGIQSIQQVQQLGAAAKGAGLLAYGTYQKTKMGLGAAGRTARAVGTIASNAKGIAGGIGNTLRDVGLSFMRYGFNKNLSGKTKNTMNAALVDRLKSGVKNSFSAPLKAAAEQRANKVEKGGALLDTLDRMKNQMK